MDCLRPRKARSVSRDVADQDGLQPVCSPSALPSCTGELGGPSSAATEAIGWRTDFGAEPGLIPTSCREILGVTTLLSWWDEPRVETYVAPKKRLPGLTLSGLYSPEVLSAHRAVMLSETPDCKAALLP